MTTARGRIVLGALGIAAAALIALELALGAASYGKPNLPACQLHTTREELVLSFVPSAGTKRIRWDRQTIDRALRAGLDHASHELAGNGLAGTALSFALRQLFAPSVEWFLQHAG